MTVGVSSPSNSVKPGFSAHTGRAHTVDKFGAAVSAPLPPAISTVIAANSLHMHSAANARAITNAQARTWATDICEFLVLIAASVVSGIAYQLIARGSIGPVHDFLQTGALVAVLNLGIGRLVPSGHPMSVSRVEHRMRDALLSWVLAFVTLIFIVFVMKAGATLSRGAVLSFFVVGAFVMIGTRAFLPPILARVTRRKSLVARDAIVIAAADDASLHGLIAELKNTGCREPVIITLDSNCPQNRWQNIRQTAIERVAGHARTMRTGDIFLSTAHMSDARVQNLCAGLSLIPRNIFLVPGPAVANYLRSRIDSLGSYMLVEAQKEPLSRAQRAVKRMIDIAGATCLLVFIAPLLAAIAIAIKLDSMGPVFFRQTRNSKGAKQFQILKFRTMHVLENGPVILQACKNDARITKIGRWLRRKSLDELPQLINVLKGDMSLVGPRPHAIAHDVELAKTIENYEIRQHVKPGITGWAQVHGLRGETQTLDLMYRRIEADLWYVNNCSLWLDFRILCLTIVEVLRERNAY